MIEKYNIINSELNEMLKRSALNFLDRMDKSMRLGETIDEFLSSEMDKWSRIIEEGVYK